MKNHQFCPKCGMSVFADCGDSIPIKKGKYIEYISHIQCMNCGKVIRKENKK